MVKQTAKLKYYNCKFERLEPSTTSSESTYIKKFWKYIIKRFKIRVTKKW